jgi:hypothetical protein
MATEPKIISGNEDEIWQQITSDFREGDLLEYRAIIQQQNTRVLLDIDIDLGGGFEGGYESTMLRSPLKPNNNFRFAIHEEGFIDEVGKFFGMQDVVIGYPEFDKKVLIKANDEAKVKPLFADTSVREVFQSLDDFTLELLCIISKVRRKVRASSCILTAPLQMLLRYEKFMVLFLRFFLQSKMSKCKRRLIFFPNETYP